MHHFTINDIVNLSGIKAHTLRVWEARYSILKPKRKDSNHRYYDNEDLKEILRIAYLNRRGYKISRIARMTRQQLLDLSAPKEKDDQLQESLLVEFIDAIMQLDEAAFLSAYQNAILYYGFEKTLLQVFYPLLERIGQRWMTNKTRPVQEHFASEQIKRKIQKATHTLAFPENGPVTLLFTPVGEEHEIPLLLIQYFLKKKGVRLAYFGTNTDLSTLELYMAKQSASTLHFHLITHLSYQSPDEYTEDILKRFPKQNLVVSGPVSGQISIRHSRLRLLDSMDALLNYCN